MTIISGTKRGNTYEGRTLIDRVDLPSGGRAAFLLRPTLAAPGEVVVLVRFAHREARPDDAPGAGSHPPPRERER
ncbi:MAG: hypothetical protein HY321_11415 [Armatimonadetes bacterium]|nr:hypothetical protein [Armatimonadota bacterium]